MRVRDLEPGTIYAASNGSVVELVSMDGLLVEFRYLKATNPRKDRFPPPEGVTLRMDRRRFAWSLIGEVA